MHESDAQRFLDEMRKQLGEFALSLHHLRRSAASGAASPSRFFIARWCRTHFHDMRPKADRSYCPEPVDLERAAKWSRRFTHRPRRLHSSAT
jgi:hypothetical protein